ncbi:MAG: triose-phosphate isomerase [Candidatus Marinimicrobia bacterium]|jgi:triosephosphate isomerase|nr:triose-phosphate isomerase [Candidatus Neomarinimicrobiota bacterium]MBT3618589.1 triose-phosphate isomerase [Candidatus Neomarinimicrobiota bacterium]MBT3829621.1 triose-phosphate isomerase [Candidatus Neomarinimicrobiota bacterium]MBT3997700.1 triose-phosphate isomerase [Candidatus Neomarinimicrobiota bacterium]MBT4281027.1 triose-phosphate isomerase [Candidatus Neomarinimicrobiota bacterium]
MKSKFFVVANWKMNKTSEEAQFFLEKSSKLNLNMEKAQVIFCPPFTALFDMGKSLEGESWLLGAQNMHWEGSGAFTGEISSEMLKACGVTYVILGHSERRHIFGESDEWINKKMHLAFLAGLRPIFCVGETLEERQAGNMKDVLEKQISNGLKDISDVNGFLIAYEPVWAIGTGENASVDQIEDAHGLVKNLVQQTLGDFGSTIPVLYGGSVKSTNVGELILANGVDGFLIGGASLEPESFSEIITKVETSIRE